MKKNPTFVFGAVLAVASSALLASCATPSTGDQLANEQTRFDQKMKGCESREADKPVSGTTGVSGIPVK